MTRKEFAEKYNVDYQLVVNASRRIEDSHFGKNAQFDENQLALAVCRELRTKLNRYMEMTGRIQADYDRLRVICWMIAGV